MSDFDWEETKCRFKAMSRPGLYIMVFLIMMNTCDISYFRHDVEKEFEKLNKRIEKIEKKLGIEEAQNVRRPDNRESGR
jgi:hypothetical protein